MNKLPEDNKKEIVDHLFRQESGRMVSILTCIFGYRNIELAEDVVQEAFMKALVDWEESGIPSNPSGWLMQVAKNKAIDVIRRNKFYYNFAPDLNPLLKSEYSNAVVMEEMFTEEEINDSRLRMIFTCCHPDLSQEMQIALTLRTVSGFGIPEIAKALLTTKDAVNKSLFRAKKTIRESQINFEIPAGNQLKIRLDSVLSVIYLIFNEGYNSIGDKLIRKDICSEAINLALILSTHNYLHNPEVDALLSLMYFQSARFDSRVDNYDNIILLNDQDRTRWSYDLINTGFYYFRRSASGENLSVYHIESAIAAQHILAPSCKETDWKYILELYDKLLILKRTPIVRLNRTVVICRVHNPVKAIEEIMSIDNLGHHLKTNYLFSAILGEFYSELGNKEKSKEYFQTAYKLTSSHAERKLLYRKLTLLNTPI